MQSSERPFKTLTEAMAEATAGATFNETELRAAMAEALNPVDLFGVGPTERIREQLATVVTREAEYTDNGKPIPKALQHDRAVVTRRLAMAERRDQIEQARRALYPECWCFGLGGRNSGKGIYAIDAKGKMVTDGDAGETYYDICAGCPEGQAEVARVAQIQADILTRAKARRLRRFWSGTRVPKRFLMHPLDTHPDKVKIREVKRWALGMLGDDQRPGLILAGPNQRGKSTIAYHLALRKIEQGDTAICEVAPDLFDKLLATLNHDKSWEQRGDEPTASHQDLLNDLKTVDFLLLDDLGTENESPYVERVLQQILNARLLADEPLTTVITTNLTAEEVERRFGDRTWTRLASIFNLIALTGDPVGPAARGMVVLAPTPPGVTG